MENEIRPEDTKDTPAVLVPGSVDDYVSINLDCLDSVLIERIFEPKHGINSFHIVGYFDNYTKHCMVRMDHILTLLYTVKDLPDERISRIEDLNKKLTTMELTLLTEKDGFEKDTPKIEISLKRGTIETENIKDKFSARLMLTEVYNGLKSQADDLRNKQLVQQFMLAIRSSMGGPVPKATESGIIY